MPSKVNANRVTGEIDLPGQDGPHQVDLLLDGEMIATGSWQAGIQNLQFESAIGTHTFALHLTATVFGASRTGKKEYSVQFKKPGHYTLTFKYGWMPMQLPTGIETSYSPKALDVVPVSALRKKSFVGSWQPITDASEWMEFTNDGAVVFSDGTAGRITISGSQPTELIEIELVNGQCRKFQVVSLTPDQLVIAEDDEATTFRRPPSSSGKQQAGGPNDKAESNAGGTVTMASSTSDKTEGSAGGIVTMASSSNSDAPVSSSTQWWDCPWCGVTYKDDSYNPGETIVCNHCNCQFQVRQAINLRSTKERVETKGLLGRLWSGSSIKKPRRQRLIERIALNEKAIRFLSNPAVSDVQSLQRAQLLQMEIADMKRELADHGG